MIAANRATRCLALRDVFGGPGTPEPFFMPPSSNRPRNHVRFHNHNLTVETRRNRPFRSLYPRLNSLSL